jgi:hypothetical protein
MSTSWRGIAVRRTAALPLAYVNVMAGIAVRRTAALPLAYVPAIHVFLLTTPLRQGCPAQGRHDD